MVEPAVGQRTAETFVEEPEQERGWEAFSRKAVGVTATVALEQPVTFEFAQILAELVQPVGIGRKLEGGEDGGVNLFGSTTADGIASVQENLQ